MEEYILKLKELGYRCDGSLEDWEKLMNKPEWFGANWKKLAKENYEIGTDFLTYVRQYIPE